MLLSCSSNVSNGGIFRGEGREQNWEAGIYNSHGTRAFQKLAKVPKSNLVLMKDGGSSGRGGISSMQFLNLQKSE